MFVGQTGNHCRLQAICLQLAVFATLCCDMVCSIEENLIECQWNMRSFYSELPVLLHNRSLVIKAGSTKIHQNVVTIVQSHMILLTRLCE